MGRCHVCKFWAFVIASVVLVAQIFGASGYHILKKIRIPSGTNSWDYSTIDDVGRRLFIAHETQVEVVNIDSGDLIGAVTDLKGAHAIAAVSEFKHGFITNGETATVTMFSLDTLQKLSEIPAGNSPDFILYDPSTKLIFSLNSAGQNATVINASDGKVTGTINLGGRTGGAVADGRGYIYVDLKDQNTLARIDSHKMTVDQRWPIADCERPSSIDIDRKNHRLFVGCRNPMLYVVSSDEGRVITQLEVGDNMDTTAFDPVTSLIFTSTEDGLITVMHQDGPDSYRIVDTLYTKPGSKSMALDLKTHRLYVPCGDFQTVPATAGGKAKKTVVPNTFGVLVVGQ